MAKEQDRNPFGVRSRFSEPEFTYGNLGRSRSNAFSSSSSGTRKTRRGKRGRKKSR